MTDVEKQLIKAIEEEDLDQCTALKEQIDAIGYEKFGCERFSNEIYEELFGPYRESNAKAIAFWKKLGRFDCPPSIEQIQLAHKAILAYSGNENV